MNKLQQVIGYNFDANLCVRQLLISHSPAAGFCMLQLPCSGTPATFLKTNCKIPGQWGRGWGAGGERWYYWASNWQWQKYALGSNLPSIYDVTHKPLIGVYPELNKAAHLSRMWVWRTGFRSSALSVCRGLCIVVPFFLFKVLITLTQLYQISKI